MRTLVWSFLAVFLNGCAEYALIRSYPPGSKAYVDDAFVGTTPVYASFQRSEVKPGHTWRVEYGNCEPIEGELAIDVAPVRIVGFVFSLGISAIFQGPNYFVPVEAALCGGDCGNVANKR